MSSICRLVKGPAQAGDVSISAHAYSDNEFVSSYIVEVSVVFGEGYEPDRDIARVGAWEAMVDGDVLLIRILDEQGLTAELVAGEQANLAALMGGDTVLAARFTAILVSQMLRFRFHSDGAGLAWESFAERYRLPLLRKQQLEYVLVPDLFPGPPPSPRPRPVRLADELLVAVVPALEA